MAEPQARHRELWFDFWGATTRVVVPTEDDQRHLTYYFQDYITAPAESAHVHVLLSAGENEAYMTAPVARRSVVVQTSDGRRSRLQGEQTVSTPTPLPPFTLEPLNLTLTTIHAAAATHPQSPEEAVVIHGPSTAGKSCLVSALVQQGWGFLSDDTVPIDRDGRALPFSRPVGIRERAAARSGIDRDQYGGALVFETRLGATLSVHPRDLGWPIAEPARIRWVVALQPSNSFAVETLSPHHVRITLDIERHEGDAVATIEELCHA